MNNLEERLRQDLRAVTDTVVAPPLTDIALRGARRVRRRRQGIAGGGVLVLAVAVLLTSLQLTRTTNKTLIGQKPAPVGSYFPNMQPPLPPRVTVVALPAAARPPHGPTRDEVVAADRAFWQREPMNAKWSGLHEPLSGGDLQSADLVAVSAPGYERPSGLGVVSNRVAWMLVSTAAAFVFDPSSLPCVGPARGCHLPSLGRPQTVPGTRYEFIDAATGAGLLAIGRLDAEPHLAVQVLGYTKAQVPPPAGARGLTGGPVPANAIDVVLPAPKSARPVLTKQQAYDVFAKSDFGRSAPLAKHPHSAELVLLARLQPPAGDPDYQDATWHRTLVWLVIVRDVPVLLRSGPGTGNPPASPRTVLGVDVVPVDATTGEAVFFDQTGG